MTEGLAHRDLLCGGRLFLPALRELEATLPASATALLDQAGLSAESLVDLRARVPLGAALRLFRQVCASARDPLFPLRASRRYDEGAFDLVMRALVAQPDGNMAMDRARRFAALTIEGLEITYVPEHDRQHVVFTLQRQPVTDPHLAEYLVGLVARIAGLVGRSQLPVLEVEWTHAPRAEPRAYRELLGCPVHFGRGRTSLALPNVNLALPEADPVLATLLEDQAEAWLSSRPTTESHRTRVAAFIARELGRSRVSLDDAARALGMSARTLRRRLEDERTSYGEILDEQRREKALALLSVPSRSIAEVAFAVGFESTGAFRRAFVRWTGTNARRYRAAAEDP